MLCHCINCFDSLTQINKKMNSEEIIKVMKTLDTPGSSCPYCSRTLPKHENDCVFLDYTFIRTMLEVYVNPSINPNGMDEILYGFIKERSERKYILDAVCYTLTDEVLYKELGITGDDMKYFVNIAQWYSNYSYYVYIIIVRHLRRRTFFRKKDSLSKERYLKALAAIGMIRDVRLSKMGKYDYDQVTKSQIVVLDSLRRYLDSWSRRL